MKSGERDAALPRCEVVHDAKGWHARLVTADGAELLRGTDGTRNAAYAVLDAALETFNPGRGGVEVREADER